MKRNLKEIHTLILAFLSNNPLASSSEIHKETEEKFAYATVKRALNFLTDENYITITGKGKATKYSISPGYELFIPIDVEFYFQKEIDERTIKTMFNQDLIKSQLTNSILFTQEENNLLNLLQNKFKTNIESLTDEGFIQEFERLAIDLSWKSSQIEGNTYSLLETERLLKEQETAAGKTKDEAVMLLNHKTALDFILENTDYTEPLSLKSIEDIHSLLMKDLNVERNIRHRRVGISGTNYKPLDNEHQIRDAMLAMCNLINLKTSVFEKAFLVLVLISYIQPFADGNKRTARIISNAILMNHKYCPISYRTIDSIEYKKAMLIFYEQNNISAFKKIFIEQFDFAVNNYF